MNKLYLITGPAGVGKSTISRKIAESLDKSALIEGDDIYHHVVGGYVQAWKDGNHLEVFWKSVIGLITNYLSYGYDVVFNYIISKKDYEKLKEIFKDYKVVFKVLLVSEEEIMKRDSLREKDCRMGERCIVLLNSFKNQDFDEKNIVDTTDMSIEETLKEVLKDEN